MNLDLCNTCKFNKVFFFFLIIILLIIFSCNNNKPNVQKTRLTKENISAQLLWKRITVEDNYKRWGNWPGLKGFFKGQVPHGSFHKVYISNEIKNALPITNRLIPDNGIIVKENYTPDKKLDSFTIMAKVKDFDPQHHNWFWAKYDKNGKPVVSGIINSCISCHKARENNDYIMIHTLGTSDESQ